MGRMLLARSAGLVLVFSAAFACASEDDEPVAEPPEPPAIARDVRDRCSDFAARLCASAADCCESTGAAFSRERCIASFSAEFCVPAGSLVGAEKAEYHPEAEEPCLAAWARAHASCVVDWDEILSIRRDVWSACKMVRGLSPAGSGCSTSTMCEQPEGPVIGRCLSDGSTQLTCQLLEILAEGAACPFPNGDVSVCDTGLYCTSAGPGEIGTCERATAEGVACDATVPDNPECGLGSYCGLDDGRCHRATNFGGGSCAQGSECVSFKCEMSSAGGTCIEALSTAADLCERGAPT